MTNPFKTIDNFLQACEDYFDFRVKTGQVVGDVKILSGQSEKYTERESRVYYHRIKKPILKFLKPIWAKLVLIPLVKDTGDFIIDTFLLTKNHAIALFIIFSICLPAFILLYNLFIKSPVSFFIWLLPLFLFTTICFSTLYMYMDKKSKGEKTTLLSNLFSTLRNLRSISGELFTHIFTIFIFINLFFVFAFFLSYFYEVLGHNWTNSFSYWYFVVFSLLLTLFTILIFNIIFYQAYFFIILEKNSLSLSLTKAWKLVETYYFKYVFFTIAFTLLFFYIIYSGTIAYFPSGLVVSLFFFYHGTTFFQFLLRRKFINDLTFDPDTRPKNIPLITGILIFGFATYILSSIIAIRQHQTFINLIDFIQEMSYIEQQLQTYTNKEENYSIQYPKSWNLYEEKDNATTFHYNYTNTRAGGIFLNIKVAPFAETNFNQLYNIRPGLVAYNTLNRDVTFKTGNLSLKEYEGVKYRYYKAGIPTNTYEIHYLIHKDDKQYDISFKTFDVNVEGNNLRLFERIANSFKFEK